MKAPHVLAVMALLVSTPVIAGEKTGASADFAGATAACVAALGTQPDSAGKLVEAGWQQVGANPIGKKYAREGTPVAIIMSDAFGSATCVVDGYLDKKGKDGLDEVIEANLSQTYGDALKANRNEFGTGFVVGDVMAILSFENRSGGLSTRITAMSMADEK